MGLSDLQLQHAAFDLWMAGEGDDNRTDIEKARRILPIVLDEVCTVTQKEYIMAYFFEGCNIPKIAKRYGVNVSTVSRTINRGLDKAWRYLRFMSPLFMKAPRRKRYLTNRATARKRR